MKKSIINLTHAEVQATAGGRNECGCISHGEIGTVELCDAPSVVKCWELCCQIKGSYAYQWLNNPSASCDLKQTSLLATINKYNPILWGIVLLLGNNEVSKPGVYKKDL